METNCKLPAPVKFNCWKHHLEFIRDQVKKGRKENLSAGLIKKILLVIGESRMDLYCGKLSPRAIAGEIIDSLYRFDAHALSSYKNWLYESGRDYRLLTLSDSSVWTLRTGKDKKQFVHIHPGRYSPLTFRVRALTLKSAIAAVLSARSLNEIDIGFLNKIRKNILDAPPLKSFSYKTSLGKLINLLEERG